MSGLVTCKITSTKPHPQAQKLKVCQVSDGSKSYSIVCGAQNVRENMITILAKPGSTTPHGLNIQSSNIRGTDSEGMLCSPLELNVSQEQGIVDLNPQTTLGAPLESLSTTDLSSTPWWKYQLIERFIFDETTKKITILRENNLKTQPSAATILSDTYWFEGSLYYRRF